MSLSQSLVLVLAMALLAVTQGFALAPKTKVALSVLVFVAVGLVVLHGWLP